MVLAAAGRFRGGGMIEQSLVQSQRELFGVQTSFVTRALELRVPVMSFGRVKYRHVLQGTVLIVPNGIERTTLLSNLY